MRGSDENFVTPEELQEMLEMTDHSAAVETSGNVMAVATIAVDCDRDAVLYLCDPVGPSCHTGRPSCFFTPLSGDDDPGAALEVRPLPALSALEQVLIARRDAPADASYTRSLLDRGPPKIAEKVREEADELGRALEGESDARVVSEAADVLYHLLVGLLARGVPLADVQGELLRRFGVSGHAEKASRE